MSMSPALGFPGMLAMLGLLAACTADAPPRSRLLVSVLTESDPGAPLEEVSVSVNGEVLGRSDQLGLVQAVLAGQAGQKLSVEYDCPPGYRAVREGTALQLPDLPASGQKLNSVELTLRCPPRLRTVAMAVRAKSGAKLAVLLNGEPVTQTDAQGVAHFSTEAEPGTQLTVKLDTTKRPDLRPQNPTQHFVVPDREEAFLVSQSFRSARRRKRKPAKPFRIIKIE